MASQPGESAWTEETAKKFESKQLSKYMDPCQEAANRSLKCLARNGGEKEMCNDYFLAYRDCKKQWLEDRNKNKKGFFG
ncbi:hypothetical protein P152DRAFT_455196 [Eremomyces bilateralis CBS 781.70]|uniref:Uncharacterized protein n=1 Tax=Eremomyces bilateralis CBS 781.70 TaxID=1392243 RepID=A0A6G1GBX1_9PEZI|nr:uncharacterized protein P152DRAFT_455196 [Eremomyces bilateralis CBS 781.70]KAF1815482.1 hypothetical protein P152DRAFT_455196 [Eremomyces bilateralis CBS 781.70]